jgi:hypothetical protein
MAALWELGRLFMKKMCGGSGRTAEITISSPASNHGDNGNHLFTDYRPPYEVFCDIEYFRLWFGSCSSHQQDSGDIGTSEEPKNSAMHEFDEPSID